MDSIIKELTNKDDKKAYARTKEIVVFRPELSETINAELNRIDLAGYNDSMVELIRADIAALKELIAEVAH